MQRGHALEETARLELEKITGHFFLPQVKFHNSISYMMASLDGIDPEGKYIAEIKCPNREDHSIAYLVKFQKSIFLSCNINLRFVNWTWFIIFLSTEHEGRWLRFFVMINMSGKCCKMKRNFGNVCNHGQLLK